MLDSVSEIVCIHNVIPIVFSVKNKLNNVAHNITINHCSYGS